MSSPFEKRNGRALAELTSLELHCGSVDNLDEFWSRYRSDPSPDLRDRLVLQYAPLVKFYAGRAPGDPREAVERGLEVLTAAIDDYDPSGGSFELHATEAFLSAYDSRVRADAFSWSEGWAEV
jgi:RNA polymerase sigma factor FliA